MTNFITSLNALELKCEFEEVYTDGSTQQGFFLIKDQSFRYEYFNPNLFIILKNNNNFYLVDKKDTEKFQIVSNKHNHILKKIISILEEYPNIQEFYQEENLIIKIEKNNNFPYRIAIKNKDIALSIYINDCKSEKIDQRFFYYFPYYPYQ